MNTLQETVAIFEQWGFQVAAGPREGEITLILESADFRSTSVHPASVLPEMADVILNVRWRNGSACLGTTRPPAKTG